MRFTKNLVYGLFFVFAIFLTANVSADVFSANLIPQSGISQNFSDTMCQEGQDFIIQIAPLGCTPAVVRTDLLEENNVPVYCKLGATKINPLINVESIDSVSFSGQYSKEISGIAFHPAKSALGVEGDLNSPVLNNIGYVVINLKKQANSSAIPDYISGDLTAKIKYNIKNAFGIGDALFYLQPVSDNDWEIQKSKSGFWNGKGYLRVEDIEADNADISVYSSTGRISSVNLKKGATSKDIYLPGFECKAGLKLKLESLENSDTRALLKVNADVVEVAVGEKFLDNKCEVKDLKNYGINKQVTIKCTEDSGTKTFPLTITPKITLDIDGKNDYLVGDYLYHQGDKRVYLVYAGTKKDSSNKEDLIAYFAAVPGANENKLSDEQISSFSSLVRDLNSKEETGFISEINEGLVKAGSWFAQFTRFVVSGESIKGIQKSELIKDIYGKQVSLVGYAGAQDIELEGKQKEYYDKAKEDYEMVKQQYATETFIDGGSTFGERVLVNEIGLASSAGQKETAFKLCDEFKQQYKDSPLPTGCTDDKLSSIDIGERYVTINQVVKKISFEGIFEPTYKDYGVKIMINLPDKTTISRELTINQAVYLDSNSFVKLVSADENSAKITYSLVSNSKEKTGQITLEKEVPKQIEKYSFTLTSEINLKKIAKVSVIPNIAESGTQANFSFKIGIEKRTFQMSPDKIKQTITTLNKTITDFNKISEGLGKTVETLKTACLATGATLIAKNFLTNLGGAGVARQYIMRGTNGWFEKCDKIAEEKGISIEKCFNENADEIDADVESLSKIIEKQNADIKLLEDQHINPKQFLSEKVIDTEGFMGKSEGAGGYIDQVQTCLKKLASQEGGDTAQLSTLFTYENWKANIYSKDQLRELELDCLSALGDSSSTSNIKETAKSRMRSTLKDIQTTAEADADRLNLASSIGINPNKVGWLTIGKDTKKVDYLGLTLGETGKEIKKYSPNPYENFVSPSTPVYLAHASNGKTYLFVLDDSAKTSKLPIKNLGENSLAIYDYDSMSLIENPSPEITNLYFEKSDASTYANTFKNAKLKYYETEPYKGMPAVVPFDLKNGWYAATEQTLAIGANIQAYGASGRVSSFWLCNVGINGNEEFQSSTRDDKCQMINLGTGQPYNVFNGLDETQAKNLIDKAQSAILAASRLSESQRKGKVNINGVELEVGSPAVDVPQFECQDFMSPKECLLLFNLCDPVICPPSRCDLGGAYKVKDVIQTGVIGSLFLCLPNFNEGILMPVCLTGVQAGVDGLLSVLSGTRDCLQESLNTGKTVGICDEIFSVYMCNFFWEQALPISDIIIPKMIEWVLGQNVRGGGEYSGVTTAWSAAEKSINYFTNYYGANSKQAFLARTTDGIKEGFCKSFISGVVPSGADFVNTITKADSPVQFTGRFDEIPFTSVTVPPTSHYKVFYHIYAGKDAGAYYQVYLKGNSESSYYQDTISNVNIASGYIPIGGYASDTPDKIITSGYNELCISVNGQEECGFKEVSTSFALNYVKDQYLKEQATAEIKTESECISGTTSVYSLLNSNVQSTASELLNPEIYSRGIIRICATANPGKGTDPSAGTEDSRWKDVGYCGDEKVKCWIDTDSVKEVIKTTTVEGEALTEVSDDYLIKLRTEGGYLQEGEFADRLEKIKSEKDSEEKIKIINSIIEKVFTNREKATLLFLRGDSYWDLLRKWLTDHPLTSNNNAGKTTPNGESDSSSPLDSTPTNPTGQTILDVAKSFVNEKWLESRLDAGCDTNKPKDCYDNVCARFVVRVLATANIKTGDITKFLKGGKLPLSFSLENIDNLIILFNNNPKDFKEITDFSKLDKGDIIIFGEKFLIFFGDQTQHITLFQSYTSNKQKVNVYGAPGFNDVKGGATPAKLQALPISSSSWYIHKAYRYIG
ncbi:MAG: hypothetical protein AABW47_00520 [Nanoarchaeota archaeon]